MVWQLAQMVPVPFAPFTGGELLLCGTLPRLDFLGGATLPKRQAALLVSSSQRRSHHHFSIKVMHLQHWRARRAELAVKTCPYALAHVKCAGKDKKILSPGRAEAMQRRSALDAATLGDDTGEAVLGPSLYTRSTPQDCSCSLSMSILALFMPTSVCPAERATLSNSGKCVFEPI